MVLFFRLNLIKTIHKKASDCINQLKIFLGNMSLNPLAFSVADMKSAIAI